MEQLMANLLAVGYTREAIDRARKRGAAYQCVRCHNTDGTKVVNIKCRMEEHIIKYHLTLEEVPFRCLLCDFVCLKNDHLLQHVAGNARHVLIAAKQKIIDNSPYLWKNPNPHVFGANDYLVYNQEASLLHFVGAMDREPQYEPTPSKPAAVEKGEQQVASPSEEVRVEAPAQVQQPVLQGLSFTAEEAALGSVMLAPQPSTSAAPELTDLTTLQPALMQQLMNIMKSIAEQQQTPGSGQVMTPAEVIPQVIVEAVGQEEESPATMLEAPTMASGDVIVAEVREECDERVGKGSEVTEVAEVAESSNEVGPASIEVEGEAGKEQGEKEEGEIAEAQEDSGDQDKVHSAIEAEGEESDKDDAGTEGSSTEKEEDVLELQDENMTFSSPAKRKREEDTERTQIKRLREGLDDTVRQLSERTLVESIESQRKVGARSVLASEALIKAVVDNTFVLSKLTDVVGRMYKRMEEYEKSAKKREENRQDIEDRRNREWRAAFFRLRTEERRWEQRRRELDRRDREAQREREEKKRKEEQQEREERRKEEDKRTKEDKKAKDQKEERKAKDQKVEGKAKDQKEERKEKEQDDKRKKKPEDEDKENTGRPRSVLGRIYTKDKIMDKSKRN